MRDLHQRRNRVVDLGTSAFSIPNLNRVLPGVFRDYWEVMAVMYEQLDYWYRRRSIRLLIAPSLAKHTRLISSILHFVFKLPQSPELAADKQSTH